MIGPITEVFSVGGRGRGGVPELGWISAQLHVRPERAQMKSGLNHSQRSLFEVDGLLQTHYVLLLLSNLLEDLLTRQRAEPEAGAP